MPAGSQTAKATAQQRKAGRVADRKYGKAVSRGGRVADRKYGKAVARGGRVADRKYGKAVARGGTNKILSKIIQNKIFSFAGKLIFANV